MNDDNYPPGFKGLPADIEPTEEEQDQARMGEIRDEIADLLYEWQYEGKAFLIDYMGMKDLVKEFIKEHSR